MAGRGIFRAGIDEGRLQGDPMPTTFQKRQKEFKRQEKQKMKAEKREQKKLANRAQAEALEAGITLENAGEGEILNQDETDTVGTTATETQPQN
jgi:hypothetical protein